MKHAYVTLHLKPFHARDEPSVRESLYEYLRHATTQEVMDDSIMSVHFTGSCEKTPCTDDCQTAIDEGWT